jgi:hypothetical protein
MTSEDVIKRERAQWKMIMEYKKHQVFNNQPYEERVRVVNFKITNHLKRFEKNVSTEKLAKDTEIIRRRAVSAV